MSAQGSNAGREIVMPSEQVSGQFQCVKCLLSKLATLMTMRNNQKICVQDVRSYNHLQARWSSNRALRTMWMNMSAEDKVLWYRNHQDVPAGTRRSHEEMMHSDYAKDAAVSERMEVDELIPWRIFRRRSLADGTSLPQAAHDRGARALA